MRESTNNVQYFIASSGGWVDEGWRKTSPVFHPSPPSDMRTNTDKNGPFGPCNQQNSSTLHLISTWLSLIREAIYAPSEKRKELDRYEA